MFKKITLLCAAAIICLTISFMQLIPATNQKSKIIYLYEKKARSLEQSSLNKFIHANDNVVLIFYEDWCGPCKRMKPIVEDIANGTDNILFIKIKRSLYKEIFIKLGFTTIPAMVFFKKGKIVHRRPQSATKEEMMALINTYFI